MTEPEPHAEPLETSIPCLSSSANKISLLLPKKEALITPGAWFSGCPLKMTFEEYCNNLSLNSDSNFSKCKILLSKFSIERRTASAKPTIPEIFSVPALN